MSLWPPPRRVGTAGAGEPLVVPAGAPVALELAVGGTQQADPRAPQLAAAVAGLRRALKSAGCELATGGRPTGGSTPDIGAACRVSLGPTGAERAATFEVPTDESYRLHIDRRGLAIRAATSTGVFRAASTLRQWFAWRGRRTAGGFESPAVEIEDRPDFPIRGAMLDVSRNRVPRMDYLKQLVERLADWKVNHLQLYVEHTYAYADHEDVWRGASPLTADEIRRLDAFCRERFIELTPNQNSFGHFHRWLIHDRYRALAEVPAGFRHPFSIDPEPFGLCATDPRATELLADLYDELLPLFGSRRFNVGLDETLDLGRGRSAEACATHGRPAVYLEFLRRVHRLAADRGRQMLFWGDIVLEHPELIDRVPEDAVALCWGYEADHPFGDQCARLAASGREFWVCPGTSSWNSLGGRLGNAVSNLAVAAAAGLDAGARGLLVTDWGDHGHLQPPAIGELPLSIGAGFAWSVRAACTAERQPGNTEETWLDHAARFVCDGDEVLARTIVELGALDPDCGGPVKNGAVLFYLLRFIDDDLTHRRFRRLSLAGLQRTHVRLAAIRRRLAAAQGESGGGDPRHAGLDWTCRLLAWCCRLGSERLAAGRQRQVGELAPAVRASLDTELHRIADDLPGVWLATSREGGLQCSIDLLRRAAATLAVR